MSFLPISPRHFFARELAKYLHREQGLAYNSFYDYPGGFYIGHIVPIEKLVWDWGYRDEDILIATLLHDSREDTNVTWNTLLNLFGHRVANTVETLTRDKEVQQYFDYIRFVKDDDDARIIKMADLTVNLDASVKSRNESLMKRYTKALEILQ